MVVPILLFVILILLVVAALLVVRYNKEQKALQLRIDKWSDNISKHSETFESYVQTYVDRVNLIDPHVSDYTNSVKAETGKALYEARRILLELKGLAEKARSTLETGNLDEFAQVKNMLNVIHPLEEDSPPEEIESVPCSFPSIPNNWEEQVEALIQFVGKDLLRASRMAGDIQLPKPRGRKPTLVSLREAGIEGIEGE